jgi:hypothetical protein
VRERTLAGLHPGAVVLLHERPGTVDAVAALLAGELAGWRAVSVSELAQSC